MFLFRNAVLVANRRLGFRAIFEGFFDFCSATIEDDDVVEVCCSRTIALDCDSFFKLELLHRSSESTSDSSMFDELLALPLLTESLARVLDLFKFEFDRFERSAILTGILLAFGCDGCDGGGGGGVATDA